MTTCSDRTNTHLTDALAHHIFCSFKSKLVEIPIFYMNCCSNSSHPSNWFDDRGTLPGREKSSGHNSSHVLNLIVPVRNTTRTSPCLFLRSFIMCATTFPSKKTCIILGRPFPIPRVSFPDCNVSPALICFLLEVLHKCNIVLPRPSVQRQ